MSELDLKYLYSTCCGIQEKHDLMKYLLTDTIKKMLKNKQLTTVFLSWYLKISRPSLNDRLKKQFNESEILLLIELIGNYDELHSEFITRNFVKLKLKRMSEK